MMLCNIREPNHVHMYNSCYSHMTPKDHPKHKGALDAYVRDSHICQSLPYDSSCFYLRLISEIYSTNNIFVILAVLFDSKKHSTLL